MMSGGLRDSHLETTLPHLGRSQEGLGYHEAEALFETSAKRVSPYY